jgi:hypothetical protein
MQKRIEEQQEKAKKATAEMLMENAQLAIDPNEQIRADDVAA